ncbi:MAG: glycerol-3-phosphate 1-O-acyltransferase PlsY [Burkholderiales bacterium]
MTTAFVVLAAYLIGSLSFAVVVSRGMRLPDPRTYGSGNPGATNVLRSGSKAAAILTLLGDVAKGWFAVWGAQQVLGSEDTTGIALAALAVVVGHMAPVFHRFQGGKGVATSLGVMLALDWRVALGTVATFLVITAFFRYVSLASMIGAAFAAFFTIFLYHVHPYAWAVLAIAVLTIWRHRSNIRKLMAGTESRLGRKAPSVTPGP